MCSAPQNISFVHCGANFGSTIALDQACTMYDLQELFLWPMRAFSIAENVRNAQHIPSLL